MYNQPNNFFHFMMMALLALIMITCSSVLLLAQSLSVSISSNNAGPNNCQARTLSAQVSGGSGQYTYLWSSDPPSGVNLGNLPTLSVSPTQLTTYTVGVQDLVSGQFASASMQVGPILSGAFSTWITNIFTAGNFWEVRDAQTGFGPLNAYRYELTIYTNASQVVYSKSETLTSGPMGIPGGYIKWNGRWNGNGAYVPSGAYFYHLRLFNCNNSQLYYATVFFINSGSSSAPEELTLFPNPASSEMSLSFAKPLDDLWKQFKEMPLIIIRDEEGHIIDQLHMNQAQYSIPLDHYTSGNYYLQLKSADPGIDWFKRFIIRK